MILSSISRLRACYNGGTLSECLWIPAVSGCEYVLDLRIGWAYIESPLANLTLDCANEFGGLLSFAIA